MRKLFQKILLLIIPIIVLLSLYSFYGEWYYNLSEYPMWASKKEFIQNTSNKQGLKIILGDSKALVGFIPDVIDTDFYNLSLGGGSPMEGYYQLKNLIDNNNSISELILSYSPYHFEFHESFFERTIKYSFLSPDELNEIIDISQKYNNKFWDYNNEHYIDNYDKITTSLKIKSIYYKLFYNYLPEFKQSIIKPRIFNNRDIYNKIIKRKGNFDFGLAPYCDMLNLEAKRNQDFNKNEVLCLYFEKILKLAKENKISTYYINTPFNKASYDAIDKKYINDYNNLIYSFSTYYDSLKILNELIYLDNDKFGDLSHLNSRGQNEFSNYVKTLINTTK